LVAQATLHPSPKGEERAGRPSLIWGSHPEHSPATRRQAITTRQTITLRFNPPGEGEKPIGKDLSALATIGRTLFCASDETACIEQFVRDPVTGRFEGHQSISLTQYFELPAGDEEIDIEGLAVHEGCLWITGSHSLKRRKPDGEDPFGSLSELKWDANRSFLGYLPLEQVQDGVFRPSSDAKSSRRPRMMKVGRKGRKSLRWLLRDSALLQPFIDIPAKENGFDIEGLAIISERVVVGLRGPVVGRYGFLLSVEMEDVGKHYFRPKEVQGETYRLHAIDLGGFGVRDLLMRGDELLILAGPTQAIEGLARVYALPGFSADEQVIGKERLRKLVTLPMREECDHAEGIALLGSGEDEQLLVAHDNPAPERHDEEAHELALDVLPLPPRSQQELA
jgi:hypothetical protein